jgi:hypothetical protein
MNQRYIDPPYVKPINKNNQMSNNSDSNSSNKLNSNEEWSTISTSGDKKRKAYERKERQKKIKEFSKDVMPLYRRFVIDDCKAAYIQNQPRLYHIGENPKYDFEYDSAITKAVEKATCRHCGCGRSRDDCLTKCSRNHECETILLKYYNHWKEDDENVLAYEVHKMGIFVEAEEPATPKRKDPSPKRKAPVPVKMNAFSALAESESESESDSDSEEVEECLTTPKRSTNNCSPSIKEQRKKLRK